MRNKFLIGFAVVAAVIFSGMLGKGDLLGVKTVFGYAYRHAPSSGTVVTATPTVSVQTPVSAGSYVQGTVVSVAWTSNDGNFVKYKVSYSTDGGANWQSITDNVAGTAYSWTVPNAATTTAQVKVEGYDYSGALLASGVSSGNFTIVGTIPAPAAPTSPTSPATPPPAVDSTVAGAYTVATAKSNTPDINTDKALPAAEPFTAWCVSGSVIKGSAQAVYYCGNDGKRYVFVNDKAFFSWYSDFSKVQTIADETLAKITIGGNITYRPGSRMVKIQSDPKVYAISRGGTLRWVPTEAAAKALYGDNWSSMIDDVPDSFFVNYKIGAPLN